MENTFSMQLFSDVNRDSMVVEVYIGNDIQTRKLWATIENKTGRIMIYVTPEESLGSWEVTIEELQYVLQRASEVLHFNE